MIKRIKRAINNYRELRQTVENDRKEIEKLNRMLESKNGEINNIASNNSAIENSLSKMINVLEYKFWQNKMFENRFLYEEYLKRHKEQYDYDYNPKVSIIIPVYNGGNYLKYAIDSALNQTYKNIEIIVVNDGSNDGGETDKIAKSYGSKIKYVLKENGGVSSALNTGIKNMSGDYFAWLSHDDTYYSNHVETNVEYLRYFKNKNIIPYSCFDFIDPLGKIKVDHTTKAGIHIYDYKLSVYTHYSCILRGEVNGGNVLIPKKAFEEVGYFEEGNRITQEKDMWGRLLKKYKFINIPIITYSIRMHDKQVSSTATNILEETKKKVVEIINQISEEEMVRESGSVSKFYQDLYIQYSNNELKGLAGEMLERYKKIF